MKASWIGGARRCMLTVLTLRLSLTMSWLMTTWTNTPQTWKIRQTKGTGTEIPQVIWSSVVTVFLCSLVVLIHGAQRNSQDTTIPSTWLWVWILHAFLSLHFAVNNIFLSPWFPYSFSRRNMAPQVFWSTHWGTASMNTSGTRLADISSWGISSSLFSFYHSWQPSVLWSSAL